MIDKSKALNVFHITEQEYDEMLVEFVAQARAQSSAIGTAIEQGALDKAAVVAHSLKGVSGNLRLDACFNIAKNIEFALKENKTGEIKEILFDLENAIQEIADSIKQ